MPETMTSGDWELMWDAARRNRQRKQACQEVYRMYLRSEMWRSKTQPIWNRARGRCERCKMNYGDEVHHKTYVRRFREAAEDLELLCEGCHAFVHGFSHHDPKDWRAARQREFWEHGQAA